MKTFLKRCTLNTKTCKRKYQRQAKQTGTKTHIKSDWKRHNAVKTTMTKVQRYNETQMDEMEKQNWAEIETNWTDQPSKMQNNECKSISLLDCYFLACGCTEHIKECLHNRCWNA